MNDSMAIDYWRRSLESDKTQQQQQQAKHITKEAKSCSSEILDPLNCHLLSYSLLLILLLLLLILLHQAIDCARLIVL